MPLTLDFILRSTGGVLIGQHKDLTISSVVIDSRTAKNGSLFACLPGENTDGHDHAKDAVGRGCAAILATRDPFHPDKPSVPVIIVDDVAASMRKIASDWRDEYGKTHDRVIALTGTAGKTTIKEMLVHVLKAAGPISYTQKNLNNSLGVPLSILNAKDDAFCWVIEAGISHAGDMEELGSLIRPNLALILNAGLGHTEGLGALGTAHHKAQLLRYIQPGGTALVNADYPELVREARTVYPKMIFFTSSGKQVEYRAAYVKPLESGHGRYRLWLEGNPIDIDAPFIGAFAAENLIAVAAVAHLVGLDITSIIQGLKDVPQPPQRFCLKKNGNWLIIDDCYNANPLSMSRMLSAAVEVDHGRPLFCMLGAMMELGEIAEVEHEKLGRLLTEIRPAAVFWTGPYFEQVRNGIAYGHTPIPLYETQTIDSFLRCVAPSVAAGGVIFFKGSRSNRLERHIEAFANLVGDINAL